MVVDFRVLGPLEVYQQGRPLSLGPPRTRAVLGILLARQGGLVSVDQLVDELWPQQPPPAARALVHGYVSRVRRVLSPAPGGGVDAGRLVTRKPGYLLRADEGEVDLHRYERLIAQARAARKAQRLQRCVALFGEAHGLWRGEPFADVERTPSIAAVVVSLTELRLAALEERFEATLLIGQDDAIAAVVAELTQHVAAHPLRERLVAQLMLALYRTGRKADALTAFRS